MAGSTPHVDGYLFTYSLFVALACLYAVTLY